ncbi:protein kinase [Candidatus Uhrbacteria bacterium]|nr:protein kinase [Candidatus Uhrbacteria bacterium]
MPDIKETIFRQIISAAVGLEGPAMWQAIDRAADEFVGDEKTKFLAEMTAITAHQACFSGDGRHLLPVIRWFCKLKLHGVLDDILATAMKFGELSAVQEIRRVGGIQGLPELMVPEFAEWLRDFGIRWFDIYEDETKGVSFVDTKDVNTLKILVAQEFPDQEKFWMEAVDEAENDPSYPQVRLALLKAMAEGRDAVVPTPSDARAEVDNQFRRYAQEKGIRILRQLAKGKEGLTRCSNIYLALDSDGIIKVFKEVLMHEEERIGAELDVETDIFPLLSGVKNVPKYYGEIELDDGTVFLVRSCVYGQSLADYVHPGQLMDKDSACAVIRAIAEILGELHGRGVMYLDLRPENVMVNSDGVSLFDFNASRRDKEGEYATAYILDPKFAPPEVTIGTQAGTVSDIFQLGLLFHQLLYGKMPFVSSDELLHGDDHREQAVLKFALANAMLPYEHDPAKDFDDERLLLIRWMLEKEPDVRPSAEDVVKVLSRDGETHENQKLQRRAARNRKEKNTVIFPARMGIPHSGHIDYIGRLLDLGYHVRISLQRSYTSTDRDPLPKWLVMKMVARSLLARGYDPGSFSFMLTPYFETDEEHHLHFAMMPGREDVTAVASSNPTIRELFQGMLVLDQKSVFGKQSEEYEDRSWGETLRLAVKKGDVKTMHRLAAEGVADIMTFQELRDRYYETPVEFLPGKVIVAVTELDGETKMARVRKYDQPEEIAARLLDATILAPFDRDTLLQAKDGSRFRLRYDKTEVTDGNETIFFRVIPE